MERGRRIPLILQKIVVTLISGGVTYLLTNITGQDVVWTLTLSVFVGGAALLVQFMVDFDQRLALVQTVLAEHTGEMKAMVDQSFAKVSEATELFGRVEGSAVRTDAVTELVRKTIGIDVTAPEIVRDFARSEITRLAMLMQDLQAGEASYDGEDHEWLLALTHNAVESIDATSTAVDIEFWTNELGLRYLAAQRDAIKRGVRIRRVFILDDHRLNSDARILSVCRNQAELGVDVRIAVTSTLPPNARLDPMFDFIVFDQAVSYEVTPALAVEQATLPVIASTRLVLRSDRVAKRVRRYNDLWEAGQAPRETT
jgi:hypothetical protein